MTHLSAPTTILLAALAMLSAGCRNLAPPPAWNADWSPVAREGQVAAAAAPRPVTTATAARPAVDSPPASSSRPPGSAVADSEQRLLYGGRRPAGDPARASWLDTPSQMQVRGQQPRGAADRFSQFAPGMGGMSRGPMTASQPAYNNLATGVSGSGTVQPVQFTAPGTDPFLPAQPPGYLDGVRDPAGILSPLGPTVPLDINVTETRTGRFMFGAGVNSDLGVTGQISIDERNFDLFRPPRSWDDVVSGRAFRGGGQGLRIEAMPGSQVQRYLVSLTEPYLFDTNVSLNLSGYYFDRIFDDWDEQRLGGRVSLGYRLTPDLSTSAAIRMENVNIRDPRFAVPELTNVLGDNSLFSGRFTVAHDTRDTPFFPTEGHYIELAFEQVFGTFDYSRGEAEYRQYFLVRERPDGSGRHTLAYSFRAGLSGEDTPLFENYFAGGFSTMRGFDFRGASPVNGPVEVGGRMRLLGSAEYLFPLTADDMVKGVLFVDFGTVEENFKIDPDDYRVAPGFGVRIAIPALGPAPLALDFAVPVAREDTDDVQNFSFYFGMGRG